METNGGAWCPGQPVSKDVYEYLQIDLGKLKVITLVETQGRFGNGQVSQLTSSYVYELQDSSLYNAFSVILHNYTLYNLNKFTIYQQNNCFTNRYI